MPYWNPYVSFNTRVRLEGLNYHVRNRAGVRQYGSGYLENVIQEAIRSFKHNRTAQEKAVLDLRHDRKSKVKEHSIGFPTGNTYGCIELPDWAMLKLIGNISLANSVNKNIIANVDGATGNRHCAVFGESRVCEINGNRGEQTAGHGIYFIGKSNEYENYPNLDLKNLTIKQIKENGVHIEAVSGAPTVWIAQNVGVCLCSKAWYLKYIDDSKFIGCYSGGVYGLYMINCKGSEFIGGYWGAGSGSTNAIFMQTCQRLAFIGGTVDAAGQALINMTGGCTQNRFMGMRLTNANYGGTPEAYSGIYQGGSNYMTKNLFYGLNFFTTTNNFKYCIEETGVSDENIYAILHMEDYGASYGGLKKVGTDSKADADTIIGSIV